MNDIVKTPLVAGNLVSAIVPTDMDQVWRLANIIRAGGWLPRDYTKQTKVDNKWVDPHPDDVTSKVCVAIMHGLEIGLKPMQAVQKIAIINGRPCLPSNTALSLIQASGLLEDFEEKIEGEGDLMVAVCRVKRKGIKTPFMQTFSVADAKQAGLWDQRKTVKKRSYSDNKEYEAPNDSAWYRYPKRMLLHRARIVLHDSHGDVLGGIPIAETMDQFETHDEAMDTAPSSRGSRKQPAAPVATETSAAPVIEHKPQVPISPESSTDELMKEVERVVGPGVAKKPLPPLVQRKAEQNVAVALANAHLDGIPPVLDRRPKPETPMPETALSNEDMAWLNDIRQGFSQALDLTELAELDQALRLGHEKEVSPGAWAVGIELQQAAIKRINGQDI